MKKIREKYGLVNLIICLLCIIILVINSIFISKNSLYEISDNLITAYCLNFLAGCQGVLGKWGSMSYETFFVKGQWWRCITHIYLHVGVIHMVMNISALLIAGKYVEKRYGSLYYLIIFHMTAIVDSIITCMIFSSESVGASAGIFGVIGILIILFLKKQISLKKAEIVYLIIFFVLSLILGIESLIIHMIALALGMIIGLWQTRHEKADCCQ